MFTLITLIVLALIAVTTFTVKKLLNKKREAISHTRKVYPPEILRAFEEACRLEDSEETYKDFHKRVMKLLYPKPIKRKKITKSKHTKRFV